MPAPTLIIRNAEVEDISSLADFWLHAHRNDPLQLLEYPKSMVSDADYLRYSRDLMTRQVHDPSSTSIMAVNSDGDIKGCLMYCRKGWEGGNYDGAPPVSEPLGADLALKGLIDDHEERWAKLCFQELGPHVRE